MEKTENQERPGVDRRTLIRRSAVMGGAMVWAVPTVQTLAGPAFAAGSPCIGRITYTNSRGKCLYVELAASNACCDCIEQNSGGPFGVVAASFVCVGSGACTITSAGKC